MNTSQHTHTHPRTGRGLIFTFVITLVVMVLELYYGWISGSLALLSDGVHMASHLASIMITFIGFVIAQKPVTLEKSYGYYRSEVLAALINGILLIPIAIWILYEAFVRFFNPVSIHSTEMFIVACIGLATNAVSLFILHKPSKDNLNVRSLVFHILGDLLSSVAVVLAAILIYTQSWVWVDPVVSSLIAVLILIWGIRTSNQCIHILMESSPKHINHEKVKYIIMQNLRGCSAVHDLHVWEITENQIILTAHLVMEDLRISDVQKQIGKVHAYLNKTYGHVHATFQYEVGDECNSTHSH